MEQNAIKASNESNHGLRELRDFTNFFSYSGRTVSESIGSNRTLKQDELKAKYPLAKAFMENIKKLSNYLKSHGGGTNANEYAFRIPHIEAMKEFIDVSSRMQFIQALNDQLSVYEDENIGWGNITIDAKYHDGKLIETKVLLAGQELDLSKPIRIQAVDWLGRLVDGIQIVNLHADKQQRILRRDAEGKVMVDGSGNAIYDNTCPPISLAIQLSEDSLSNQAYIDELLDRDGAINKTDISKTLLFSPFNFLVVRVADDKFDEDNDIFPTAYETPIFKMMDYSHDITFMEHADALERFNIWKEQDICYNTREFAGLNLFRWGIVDRATWDKGLAIFNAVDNAPKLWGIDTPIDGKVVHWANGRIAELKSKPGSEKIDVDNVVIAGASISKIVNVMGQAYYRMRALVVDEVLENDINFRDTYITLRSKPERTNKYQTLSRLNTDVYKIIECDKDGNFIRILNPVDIFAVVNYDIDVVVVKFETELVVAEGVNPGDVKANKEHQEYYNSISSYKG